MAKPKKKKVLKKKKTTKKKEDPIDFTPSTEVYEVIDSDVVYNEEKRVGKIFGVRYKRGSYKEAFIRLLSQKEKETEWKKQHGFNIYSIVQLDKIIKGLHKVAKKIGWKIKTPDDIESIREQLREKEETIVELQQRNEEVRQEHEILTEKYLKQKEKLLRSRVDEFKNTIKELKQKIKEADEEKIPESELQEFLYNNPWLFGTEYISAEPQKLRGAHSKFDFYLERFNKTNDIIEIKLLSDSIVNKDGTISAKVIQAVDQLIEYLESTSAAAHSTVISAEEEIKELRPRGIVIIGKDSSKEASIKLQKWNYRMNHINIMTYHDVLKKAEVVVENIERQEAVLND